MHLYELKFDTWALVQDTMISLIKYIFSHVQPQHSGNEIERLANVDSKRVGSLLGRILEKQYPNADDIRAVTFNDLLEWYMWPIFITIFGMIIT